MPHCGVIMKCCIHAHMTLPSAYAHPVCRCICTAAHIISGEVVNISSIQMYVSMYLYGILSVCDQGRQSTAVILTNLMHSMQVKTMLTGYANHATELGYQKKAAVPSDRTGNATAAGQHAQQTQPLDRQHRPAIAAERWHATYPAPGGECPNLPHTHQQGGCWATGTLH